MNLKDEQTQGFLLAIFAFFSWGCFSLFFKLYSPEIGSYEILIHRIIWSSIFMGIMLVSLGNFKEILQILRNKRLRKTLFFSGFLISINWWIYVYAVSNSQILEASLGQFLSPLTSLILAALILKEPLNKAGKIAVFLVVIAVFIQIYTLGEFPFIAIILGLSFAFYGLIRKKAKAPAISSIFIETLLMLPFSLVYFLYLFATNKSHFGLNNDSILMVFSGIITIVPLLAFNWAATRISLVSIGFMQYIIPTMSIIFALYFKETLNIDKAISFCLIWFAIFIVSLDGIYKKRHAS